VGEEKLFDGGQPLRRHIAGAARLKPREERPSVGVRAGTRPLPAESTQR
jgi:hypothetical protein